MRRNLLAIILIVLLVAVTSAIEPRFVSPRSIESILLWIPILAVLAVGQLLVIVSGGIDVSVGSILGCSGICVGVLLQSAPNLPLPLLFFAGLLVGTVLGAINASIITWGKVSPLITTIGTLAAFRGLAFLISKGDQIDSSMIPDSLTALARNGIPIASVKISWLLVIALAIALMVAFALRYLVASQNLFAFGSNPQAAYLKGISSNKVTFWVYTICGGLAGIGSVMYAARFGFVNPGSAGQNLELTVIAAVAIGGAKLTGGTGTISGVLLGCLLLSCINVALSVLGIDANWQLLTYGFVILVAVCADGILSRRQMA